MNKEKPGETKSGEIRVSLNPEPLHDDLEF